MPREAILLSGLAQVGLGFLVRLVILLMVLVWFRIVPPVTAVLFPLGILGLMLFGYLLGILLTPLGMLYHRDVMQALPLATTFLMLLTPVLYPVPEAGIAAGIATFNPLTPLVAAPSGLADHRSDSACCRLHRDHAGDHRAFVIGMDYFSRGDATSDREDWELKACHG